jgi:galactokinase
MRGELPHVRMDVPEDLLALARRVCGEPLRLYRAPGRVNLIGEHTDYNGGWVLPAAIHLFTWVAASTRADRDLVVTSLNAGETATLALAPAPEPRRDWSDYVAGVAWALGQAGIAVPGATLLIDSELPFGGGLSSSAALEVATAAALVDGAGATLEPLALAELCQRAENGFVGAQSGIMDQFAVVHGREQHALLLDCRSLAHTALGLPATLRLVIANTMTRHAHSGGGYNTRRQECDRALARLREADPRIASLRDVTPADADLCDAVLPPAERKRVRHVVSENARVLAMADALGREDLEACGAEMAASHRSLRDDFEVSTPELDVMVEIAAGQPGVYGSRLTGGGFGGCTISLVDGEHAAAAAAAIASGYAERTGIACQTWITGAADGLQRIDPW